LPSKHIVAQSGLPQFTKGKEGRPTRVLRRNKRNYVRIIPWEKRGCSLKKGPFVKGKMGKNGRKGIKPGNWKP